MSTQSIDSGGKSWHLAAPEFDPATGALHTGYRELTGTMTSTAAPVRLRAWAIGFGGRTGAAVRYEDIKTIVATVGGDGLAAIRLTGVIGNQFGSMSERSDLIGEASVIWISAVQRNEAARGALLAAHNGALVQLITVLPYEHTPQLRSTYLLEAIAASMEERSLAGFTSIEPNRAELMDRLPALDDLPLALQERTVTNESYKVMD